MPLTLAMPPAVASLHQLTARAQRALALLEGEEPLRVLQANLLAIKPPATACPRSLAHCVNALSNLAFRLLAPFQLTPHLHDACTRLQALAARRLTDDSDRRTLRRFDKPYPEVFTHLATLVDQIETILLSLDPRRRQPDIPTAAKLLLLLADALNDLAILSNRLRPD